MCGKAVASSIVHASELHGGNVCTVTCVDRHMYEACMGAAEEEVCPACETAAVARCNCVQTTKKCRASFTADASIRRATASWGDAAGYIGDT